MASQWKSWGNTDDVKVTAGDFQSCARISVDGITLPPSLESFMCSAESPHIHLAIFLELCCLCLAGWTLYFLNRQSTYDWAVTPQFMWLCWLSSLKKANDPAIGANHWWALKSCMQMRCEKYQMPLLMWEQKQWTCLAKQFHWGSIIAFVKVLESETATIHSYSNNTLSDIRFRNPCSHKLWPMESL